MSWEVWGTPPDPEPQRCPECGEESHLEGCEVGKMQDRAIEAERKLYQAQGRINALERELASSQGCVSEWVAFGSSVTDALGLRVMSPKAILAQISMLRDALKQIDAALQGTLANATDMRDMAQDVDAAQQIARAAIGKANPPVQQTGDQP